MHRPILTNAHSHLELTTMGHLCPDDAVEFTQWMRGLAWRLPFRTRKKVWKAIEQGVGELLACGTTHIGDISSTGLSMDVLKSSGLSGTVWYEVMGITQARSQRALHRAITWIDHWRRVSDSSTIRPGLSLHSPYSCGEALLREGAAWCARERVPLTIHAAESFAEVRLLRFGDGPFATWLTRPAIAYWGVPRLSPVRWLAALGVLETRPLLVHAVHIDDDDIHLTSDAGASVVHCPRSNARLSNGTMPLRSLLDEGVEVYLGTDSRASAPSLDIREEAQFACQLHAGRVASHEIHELLTRPLPIPWV